MSEDWPENSRWLESWDERVDEGEPTQIVSRLPANGSIERSRDVALTRTRLAYLFVGGNLLVSVLVIIGGLTGKLSTELVALVLGGALANSPLAVAYFYFRRSS